MVDRVSRFRAYGVLGAKCLGVKAGKLNFSSSLLSFNLALLSLFFSTEAALSQQRTIVNPSFEQHTAFSGGVVVFTDDNVPGWFSTGGIPGDPDGWIEMWRSGFLGVPASDGSFFVELNPSVPIGLYQNICLKNGEQLSWSFDHAARSGAVDPQTVIYEITDASGSVIQTLATQSTAVSAGWQTNTGSVPYTGPSGMYRLQFRSNDPGGSGNFLDNINISLVGFGQAASSTSSDFEGVTTDTPSFRVTGTVAAAVTVPVTVTGGTATAGADFTLTQSFITIPAGVYDGISASSIFPIPITIVSDSIIEPDETIIFEFGTPSSSNLELASPSCGTYLGTVTHTILDPPAPSIETIKTLSVADTNGSGVTADAGDTVTYTITIENTGNLTLTSVGVASDTLRRYDGGANTIVPLTTLPAFVSNDGAPASVAGTLVRGETATFTATYVLTQSDVDQGADTSSAAGGFLWNTATGTATAPSGTVITNISDDPSDDTNIDTDGDGDPDDPTALIILVETIETTKTLSVADTNGNSVTDAGDTVTFTITIQNTGNGPTMTNVTVPDTLTRLGGVGLTLASGPTWVSTTGIFGDPANNSSEGELLGRGGAFAGIGEVATYTATYVLVQADVDAGGISNTAPGTAVTLSGTVVTNISDDPSDDTNIDTDGDGDPDDPTVLLIAAVPQLTIVKTHAFTTDLYSDSVGDAADVISYTYVVTNTGNVPITSITVTDSHTSAAGTISPTIVCNSLNDIDPTGDSSPASGSNAIATLARGDSVSCTSTYTVTQADVDQL